MITFGAIVLLLGCSHEPPAAPAAPAATAAHTPPSAHDGHDEAQSAKAARDTKKNMSAGKEQTGSGFAVPFVWETSKNDPLAVARGHLKEMLRDNAAYVSAKNKLNPTKIAGQARTTIVTCSDAAVQLAALDTTPENDTFVTRNWGNLLDPSLGTITYGIEELHTPVLLIVGHTGCDAVKAALKGTKFSKRVRSHLGKLGVMAPSQTQDEAASVNQAVVDNVNSQVAKAVERFQPLVRTGALTVIGAVYDPLNALKGGQGRVSIVNVNTITDPVSMAAFVTAVVNDDKIVQAVALTHDSDDELEHRAGSNGEAYADGRATRSLTPEPGRASAHEAAERAHASTPTSWATTHGAARQPGASGLPQIDRLEPSLVEGAPRAQHAAAHEEHGN